MTVKRGDAGCVVVLHEVWGPDSNTESACKRLGKLGFATTMPSLYEGHEQLLTPHNIRSAMDVVWDLSLKERRDKKRVAAEADKKGAGATDLEVLAVMYDQDFRDGLVEITMDAIHDAKSRYGRVATLGFSLGGGLSLTSATQRGHPDSAVAYCAEPPKLRSLMGSTAPMLAICASHDDLMNPLMPPFVDAALKGGVDLTVKTLPNTQHDFFNQTMKDRYDSRAAEEAWGFTTRFLARTLARRRPNSKR